MGKDTWINEDNMVQPWSKCFRDLGCSNPVLRLNWEIPEELKATFTLNIQCLK